VITCLVFALATMMFVYHGTAWILLCAVALFFGGMSAGKIRTDIIANHSLKSRVTGQIGGTIIEVTRNQRGSPRYLIVPERIGKTESNAWPNTLRVSAATKHQPGRAGDYISGLARIQPISGPAFPGSFDFSFNAWFNGLGASGFFMGKPKIIAKRDHVPGKSAKPLSLVYKTHIFINTIRSAIGDRIRSTLPGESGDVAVALIIGDRTGIALKTQESLRSSGLAHVLAISGMHMALVSLTMVWAVRLLLALNMQVASHYPIKNWALFAGFFTATAYLAISGMSVATERAWIMISVMILAAIVSRKSITLRGVCVAALAILVLQPESVLSPGFQMSFAAVASIVAAYEWLDERKQRKPEHRQTSRVVRFFFSLMFTSLIAGLATSLFAAYHFHRVAPFGVLTNLMAMPLISVLVMPMVLASLFFMPYGFDPLPLSLMGWGIEWVIAISDYVNSLGGRGITGQMGTPVLPMAFIGLFFLTMLKTRLRIIGGLILLASTLFWAPSRVPDILVSEDGRAIAIQDNQGKLGLLYPRRNKFVRDIWLRAFSDDEPGKILDQGRCNNDICTARTRQGALVYTVYDPDYLTLACNRADILLAPKLRWVNCRDKKPKIIIRRGQLEEFGAHAIYLRGDESRRQLRVPDRRGADRPAKDGIVAPAGFSVVGIETAITNTNRAWNVHRKGRAAYRQD